MKIERRYPGIDYIRGWQAMPDTQIVVTRRFDEKHRALRVLSKKAMEEEATRLTEPGDRNNADAVMQVSVSANKALYEKIRRCNLQMCEALRELMKDEIESEIEEKMPKKQDNSRETRRNNQRAQENTQKARRSSQKARESIIKARERRVAEVRTRYRVAKVASRDAVLDILAIGTGNFIIWKSRGQRPLTMPGRKDRL